MRSVTRILLGFFLAVLLFILCVSEPIRSRVPLPAGQRMQVGEVAEWARDYPAWLKPYLSLKVEGESRSVFGGQSRGVLQVEEPLKLAARQPGEARVSLMLWDAIPLRTVAVESREMVLLVPGGHSIGVTLHADGILVVGFAPITDRNGEKSCPAAEAGIEIGDRILAVNGERVTEEARLADLMQAGKPVELTIMREKDAEALTVSPVFCPETGRFRIGVYVREQVSGIGTLSFWEPKTRAFAALGHIIADADTREGVPVGGGEIVSAPVKTIEPGLPGAAGEKIGVFATRGGISGSILKNCFYGIYGVHPAAIENPLAGGLLEAAYGDEVHTGPAEIFTVIQGDTIERFSVDILRLYPGRRNGKNMLLKVTDPRLLAVTGGIIQGLSGSPVIQDGRIAGVVTYVLLNDPTHGYGLFMDDLLANMPRIDPEP